MSHADDATAGEEAPHFELVFSPRALVRSRLFSEAGGVSECGQKGAEVRWQQGAIAVCILVVWTRLCALRGDAEAPLLEGERGSPARSIDNLLTKPGDWALNMFGEQNGQPAIRDFIYRKRAVSKSNTVSAVQWDTGHFSPDAIRIIRENQPVETESALADLLRVLLEEFNPRRVEREWAALFPDDSPKVLPDLPGIEEAGAASARAEEAGSQRPWLLLACLFGCGAVGFYFLGQSMSTGPRPAPLEAGIAAMASVATLEAFIDSLNAQDLKAAYGLTSPAYREEFSLEAFSVAMGDQRFNFPRIAGNPYRNLPGQRVHEYRVTLYVETEVHRILALEGLDRLPVTEIEAYAEAMRRFTGELIAAGVDPVFIRQLKKERLERPDASRYVQLICGLNAEEISKLYPERITVTLDLTYFFELLQDELDGTWRVQRVSDATDRLVAF